MRLRAVRLPSLLYRSGLTFPRSPFPGSCSTYAGPIDKRTALKLPQPGNGLVFDLSGGNAVSRRKWPESRDDNVTFVLVFENEDSVLASTRLDADHDVTWLRRKLGSALADHDPRGVPHVRCEYISF
jgi:hypothetical protein